jgi:hypothetical protein
MNGLDWLWSGWRIVRAQQQRELWCYWHSPRLTIAGIHHSTCLRAFSRRRDATVSAGNSQRDREVIPPVRVVLIRDQSRFPLVETLIKCRQYISVLKYRPFGVHFSVSPQFSFHAFVTEHINSLPASSPAVSAHRPDQQPCTQVSTTSSPTSCVTPTHFSIFFLPSPPTRRASLPHLSHPSSISSTLSSSSSSFSFFGSRPSQV